MALKEIISPGIIMGAGYFSLALSLATMGTQRVDDYVVQRIAGQTFLSPAPGYSNAVLADDNNDGMPDRKYATVASRQGRFTHDLPMTERDEEVFLEIASRL